MKYTITYILMFCLIFTLFTGCVESPESPTDALVSVVESQNNDGSESNEISAIVRQEEQIESKGETQKQEDTQTVSSKTSPSSVASKVPASTTPSKTPSKPVQSADGLVADAKVEYPTFTKESALKEWILGNHSDYFADKRNDMLSTMGNKGNLTYYRPSIPTNHSLFTLSQVNVHTPSSCFNYYYNDSQTKWAGISVYVNHVVRGSEKTYLTDYVYDNVTAKYNGEPSEYLAEGVEVHRYSYQGVDFYYYVYDRVGDDGQSISVSWLQFNTSHMASVHENLNQIEEIIPLLYLQQVKLDNSTVIK